MVVDGTKKVIRGLTANEENEKAINEYFWNEHKKVWAEYGKELQSHLKD